MCYIFNFFSWTLDLIQRIITFALACLITFAVCFGMSIAIIAGIAYGYNYSLAEFFTFSRSDITVLMRRSQFFDNPEIIFSRDERISGKRDDTLPTNTITSDYQDNGLQSNSKPWSETKDTREYAEKLTKYSTRSLTTDEDLSEIQNYFMLITPHFRRISATPIPGLSTTVWLTGSSQIIMRNFRPIEQFPVYDKTEIKDYASLDKTEDIYSKENTENQIDYGESVTIRDNKIRLEDDKRNSSFMQMRPTKKPSQVLDDPTEDTDEDTITYKPV